MDVFYGTHLFKRFPQKYSCLCYVSLSNRGKEWGQRLLLQRSTGVQEAFVKAMWRVFCAALQWIRLDGVYFILCFGQGGGIENEEMFKQLVLISRKEFNLSADLHFLLPSEQEHLQILMYFPFYFTVLHELNLDYHHVTYYYFLTETSFQRETEMNCVVPYSLHVWTFASQCFCLVLGSLSSVNEKRLQIKLHVLLPYFLCSWVLYWFSS